MVGAIARGAQSVNSKFFKAVLRKGYHTESSPTHSELKRPKIRLNEDEEMIQNHHLAKFDQAIWIPDHRTGIYYPKGQEKVMEDIPIGAAEFPSRIHWLSSKEEMVDYYLNN